MYQGHIEKLWSTMGRSCDLDLDLETIDNFCTSHDLITMDWSCDQNYLLQNGGRQPKFKSLEAPKTTFHVS